MARDPVIVMQQASRAFDGREVLSRVDVTVRPSELVGVVGPNGGGKSTLLMLMAGLLRPTSGTVRVCGVDAHQLALTTSGVVGLVTARPGLYPLLTARENLHHFAGLHGLPARAVDERVAPLASALGLARLDDRVSTFSTGMQQKLSLLRALLLSPKVLLLDEPTANLDPVVSNSLAAEIRRRVDAGLACVWVTHDLAGAEAVCDRVLLVDGAIKRELSFSTHRAPREGPLLAAWQKALETR